MHEGIERRRFGQWMGAAFVAAAMPKIAIAQTSSPMDLTIADAARRIREGSLTASAQVEASLGRIAIYGTKLNAFISVFADRARAEARVLDAEMRAGRSRGPLHGVVLSVKDNIDTAGERTTGGSPAYQMRVPVEDSPSIARLRAAGAIIIGKNNLNELAMSDGSQSFYGRVRNPWSLDRQTGGSSSGSCASVAAHLVTAAVGTDTGGSIRNPSAWCGTVGLKPTSGLVPNRGGLPLTPSLDTVGPITRTVEDAALMLGVMAGYDRLDITSEQHEPEDYVAQMRKPVAGLRVARLLGHFDRLEPDVAAAVEAAIGTISGLVGGSIGEASLPDGGRAMELMPFGETRAWYADDLAAHRYLFSELDRATLDAGADVKAEDYIRARWEMDLLRRTVNDSFASIDLMLFPTIHVVAPKLVQPGPPDPNGARAPGALFDAGLINVLGLPAISVPCGFSREGLPIGLCIVGPRFGEGRILSLAHAYEQATAWHLRQPALRPSTPVPPIPAA
ncbi:amidase [Sphingomonas sp. CGMCC 1.13654]|uniref:Amidase n=1 Tax=Sphingomonas chungangi TaxID=2683589 RepID=A0A838L720_9SPHN|nr:amidase [Sphingomonas chungangi]MBA2934837.1 amidase [Sphingomonas chungangi]MVW58148.1 amidase [Sphingomonas chungangi]